MRFRNAVHITIDNFTNVFKLLLYSLVIMSLSACFIYLILKLGLSSILNSPELQELKTLLVGFVRALISGDSEFLKTFSESFSEGLKAIVLLLGNESGSIIGAVIGVCVMYLLGRFAIGLAQFAFADNINDRARTLSRTKFYVSFTKNIGKAALYQIIYVPLSFVYDVGMFALSWFVCFYLPTMIFSHALLAVLMSIALTIASVLCLQALKLAVISNWIPSVVCGNLSVAAGFRYSFKAKNFWRRLGTFVISIFIIYTVNMLFIVFTFGSAFVLTLPMSILFVLCLQLTFYYEDNGVKYFISTDKIAGEEPPVLGE